MRRWLARRGTVRTVFDALLLVQLGHLGEHLVQIAQIHLLGWPAPQARGLVATFDVETMHFVWNVGVLAAIGWLLRNGARSAPLAVTFVWAAAHTAEHGYLITRALLSGLHGAPGILGAGGVLANLGASAPGVTTWTRPTVHLVWNVGEVALLTLAYLAFMSAPVRRWSRRAVTLAASALIAAITVLAFSATRADQAITALAPFEIVLDGRNELVGVAVAADGTRYVSDRGGGVVYRLSPTGTVSAAVTNLDRPAGLALDANGSLLIAEEHRGRIVRVGHTGALSVVAEGFTSPRWLLMADDETLYVTADGVIAPDGADRAEGRVIVRVDLGTGAVSEIVTGIRGAEGLTLLDDSVIVASRGSSTGPESSGALLRYPILPSGALGAGQVWVGTSLTQPVGLALDAIGSLFVGSKELTLDGDRSRRAIAKVHPGRYVTDFAANLVDPQGLAFGPNGSLYVADGKSGRLYQFRAPTAPTLDTVGRFTRTPSMTVSGVTETAGRVDVFVNDATPAISRLADATGIFSVAVTLAPNIVNRVHVHATARGGEGLTSSAAVAEIVHDDRAPSVAFSAPPAGAHVHERVSVSSVARDDGTGVATIVLRAASRPLSASVEPTPPAAIVMASAVWDTSVVPDGVHALSVAATDVAGNAAPEVTRAVVVDNTPPDTMITSGPQGEVTAAMAAFTFAGSDALTAPSDLTFAWRVDGGPWSAFTSATTVTLANLLSGDHVFEVKARDRAGNEDPSPAGRAFRVVFGPTLAAVTPSSGPPGTLITLAGAGFMPGTPAVTFNGVPAVVRTAANESITTTVPIGARTGALAVITPQGTTSRTFTVTSTGDFTLSALPLAAASVPGASVSYALTVVASGRFTGLVSLAIAGLPAGVTAELVPAPFVAPGQSVELRLRVAADVAPGTTHFTVTANGAIDGVSRSQVLTRSLTVGSAGQSAVVGRFVLSSGEPLPGVSVAIGAARATSDAAGNFILPGLPPGTHMLGIDANTARAGLPIYAMDVDVVAGQTTVLPTAWLTPPPPPERFVAIDNAMADQVITDERFPGVAFTLPAGVTIIGWDGTPKTRVAIERIPQDRLPVPPPPGRTRSLFQLFFGTPMGGLPSAPIPVTLPNDLGLDPGKKAQLWYYDAAPLPGAAAAWRLAGLGTVGEDGRTIVSDPGVGIARFCGVCGLSCFIDNENSQPSTDEGAPEDGEPVNLALGQHVVDAVDLLQPGRTPALVHRRYNPFDAFGRIAGFELFLGQGWALSVDAALLDVNASVRRLVMPGNARYEFVRDLDGRFRTRAHPRFRGAVIETEPSGVQALRFASGTVWRFSGGWIGRGRSQPIAGLNLLIEQGDRHDNTLTITRDRNGSVGVLTQSDGRTLVFTTSLLVPDDPTSARLTEVRDALGRTVRYSYDPTSRRLQSVVDAAGGETRYTYDAEGRIVSIRDQKGVTYVTNDYDTAGRVRSQTMADGGVWRYDYDGPVGAHTVVRVTNPRGHTTTYRIGAGSRADEVVDALGQSTRAERDTNGLAGVITDAAGRATRIDYDHDLRPRLVADRGGTFWSFAYSSSSGDVEAITDPLGNVTRFEYDAARNLRARVNPEGDRLEFGYDSGGAPTTVTDALGRTTTATYDAAGNVTSIRDPLGDTTVFEHDAGARLVKATHPNGAVTRWFHDALNRVTHIVDADGGVSAFTYDAKGSLLAFRDARGHATSYTYDAMDRLRTRADALGRTKTFAYDFNGNVVRTTDADGQTTEHEYDALNRRVRTRHADGSVVEYVYDALGRLIHVNDTEGGTVLLTYDAQGRLVEEITAQGIVRYAYDRLGRREALAVDGSIATTYRYDRNSRLTTLSQSGWGSVTLEYLPNGRLQRRVVPTGLSTRYAYDDAGRISHLLYEHPVRGVLGNLAYGYDARGRRTSSDGSLARTLLPEPTATAAYDAANQQLVFGGYTLTYDRNGDATSILGPDGLAVLIWDARRRLRRVTAAGGTLSFAYDAVGRRTGRSDNDVVASYQYAGGDVVRETRGTVELAYLRGLGADETLGQEERLAYMIDGARTTIGLVDEAGNVAQTFAYEPFGRSETSGVADRARYQFSARERDTDWLYYYRARYYSPRLGRFLQSDPLGLRGEPNPYAYALNNPIDNIDPSGLRTYIAHGCCNPDLGALGDLRSALLPFDPDVRVFTWSSDLFFDVIPSAKTPSDAMLAQIIRDLHDEPLQPGEKLNLIGHSAGGIIVNNVANALRALGIAVDNMIIMGSPLFPGIINAPLPSDIAITNFTAGPSGDFLANTLSGPNVINVPITNVTEAGTSDFLTAHTGYWKNAMVISVVQQLIKR